MQHLGLRRGELRLEDLDVLGLAGEVVALNVIEAVEDAGSGRGGAGAVFVVERQFGDPVADHGGTQFAFDEAAAQQGDEVAGEQRSMRAGS